MKTLKKIFFSKFVTWLEWWTYTNSEKIFFPELSDTDEDLSKGMPSSINAQ